MLFSKSFGYALRSTLFLAASSDERGHVPLNEISDTLHVPRHFLGKVMKKLVKEGVLSSQKGPTGGFTINDRTLNLTLLDFLEMSGESLHFESCVLRLNRCNSKNPCPMHEKAEWLRLEWKQLLSSTTIRELLKKGEAGFLQSITVHA